MGNRVMAVDPGERRMGVALSDETALIAQPLETYQRTSLAADLAHIRGLVERYEVDEVVVGLPVQLDGRPGPASQRVQSFVERLQRELSVPVVTWDERLTSKAAERMLIEADVSRRKRRDVVDRVAAAILLEGYLEERARRREADEPRTEEGWGS